jgi:hypothetical protein
MPDILPTATPGSILQADAEGRWQPVTAPVLPSALAPGHILQADGAGLWTSVDPSTILAGGVDHMTSAAVPPVAILADATTPVAIAPFAGTVAGVAYVPSDDIVGADNPDSRMFSLYNRGQVGTGNTIVAILSMVNGEDAVANDAKTVLLSIGPGDTTVAAGDVLDWESFHIGANGMVDPGGLVRITFNRA